MPVIVLNIGGSLGNGLYPLGNISRVNGDLSKVKMECYGMDAKYLSLVHQDGKLCMKVSGLPTLEPATIEIVDMAQYGGMTTIYPATKKTDYYLPVVGVKNTSVNGQTPKLSGTFTSLDGTAKREKWCIRKTMRAFHPSRAGPVMVPTSVWALVMPHTENTSM